MQVGLDKVDDFSEISRYISQTVHNRDIQQNTNENSYTLYHMALFLMTLSDPNYPKSPPFSIFYIAFRIFVTGGDRDFKFGTHDEHAVPSRLRMTNHV